VVAQVGAMTGRTGFRNRQGQHQGLMTQLFGPHVRDGETATFVQISVAQIDAQPDRRDDFVRL
jgi:hypothetical protein